IGEGEMLAEQVAVDVGEGGEGFIEIPLALFRRRVEDLKQACEALSQVRAVRRRAVFNEKAKRLALENAGVFGEQAEQDADKKPLKVVAFVAARFERVVKLAHE